MKHIQISTAVLATAGMLFCLNGAIMAQKADADPPVGATGSSATNGATRADSSFAREAAEGGMFEVELGRVAVKNASNEKAKEFGKRMIDDHIKAGDQLKQIAARDSISLPSGLDSKHQVLLDRFSKMTGTTFDRAYARDMVKDHPSDVAAFQKEADTGSNPDLKSFAGSTLPTLQDHLRMAKDNEQAVGVTSRK